MKMRLTKLLAFFNSFFIYIFYAGHAEHVLCYTSVATEGNLSLNFLNVILYYCTNYKRNLQVN